MALHGRVWLCKYFCVEIHMWTGVTAQIAERAPGPVFSYKLRYIVSFLLVEMAISTNKKPTIYHNLYDDTDPADKSQRMISGIPLVYVKGLP